MKQNYYGSLCTEMYELLHEKAPADELAFYLSYAQPEMKILEPLCGSGRFLVPFMEHGFDIQGIDLSEEMLAKLRLKRADANVIHADLIGYETQERFDLIFISSGSVSLFTDLEVCDRILAKLKELLTENGKLVFAVDTIANRCPDDTEYQLSITMKTHEGMDLILKTKNAYDEATQTQYSPGIYELYDKGVLIGQEPMDFQTHLYTFNEMEARLKKIGFSKVITYSSFEKEIAVDDHCEAFLFECSL